MHNFHFNEVLEMMKHTRNTALCSIQHFIKFYGNVSPALLDYDVEKIDHFNFKFQK